MECYVWQPERFAEVLHNALKDGFYIDYIPKTQYMTLLYKAISRIGIYSSDTSKQLIAAGANLNARDKFGWNGLMHAAITLDFSDPNYCQYIVGQTEDINAVDNVEMDALSLLCKTYQELDEDSIFCKTQQMKAKLLVTRGIDTEQALKILQNTIYGNRTENIRKNAEQLYLMIEDWKEQKMQLDIAKNTVWNDYEI